MKLIFRLGVCGVATLAIVTSSLAQEGLPKHFHGAWQVVKAGATPSCSRIDADIRMQVFSNRVDFHEGKCEFVSVETSPDRTAAEIAMSCRSEGEEWKDRQAWSLRQTDTGPVLTLDWPARDLATVHYAPCESDVSNTAVLADVCYDDGNSSLSIKAVSGSQAQIVINSVQDRAHMCNISGEVEAISGGLRYTEQIDGVGECRLDILIGEDGSIRMEDRDMTCKAYHCGMRATFDNIRFTAEAEHQC